MTTPKSHTHEFAPHPDQRFWSATHHACTICGMAIPNALLKYALAAGATLAPKQPEDTTTTQEN